MVGTGRGFTVTFLTVGVAALHPVELVYVTLTVCAPAVFQVTVMEFVPAPAVIVPPPETVQVYPVIPLSVV